jgi:hypothetical protein
VLGRVHARLEENAARQVLHYEDGGAAALRETEFHMHRRRHTFD